MPIVNVKSERRCDVGYIETYRNFAKHLECPPDYNLWTAISTVSVVLGRNCWLKKGYMTLYPNLYLVLVGPSAIGKGVALTNGLYILRESLGESIPQFSQKSSPESLIEFLAMQAEESGESKALIYVPEFSTFIGKGKLDQSMLQLLTDYWDCPEHRSYSTRSKGKEELKNVCINIQAGSTPEWIRSSIPEDAIGGGFTSRMILVNRIVRGEPNALGQIDEFTTGCKEKCISDLRCIAKLKGEFDWDARAKDWYQDWYYKYHEQELSRVNPTLEGYYGRKGTYILKLAMVHSASLDDTRVIREENLEFALETLTDNESYIQALMESMSETDQGRLTGTVSNIIQSLGVIEHSKLLGRLSHRITAPELRIIIETLIDSERITVADEGRKTLYIWITESIRQRMELTKKKNNNTQIRIV